MSKFTVRSASLADAPRLLEIYAYYVEHTAVSAEYVAPTVEEFRSRIETTLSRFPYLVAETDGVVVGYAYAGPFRTRAAYAHCCEVSLYVDRAFRGRGIGRLLYTALEEALAAMGIRNLYACVTLPICENQYHTTNSRDFHLHMGYETVGHFHGCGEKFGILHDMVFLEKRIG